MNLRLQVDTRGDVSTREPFEQVYAQTFWAVLRYFARRLPGQDERSRDLTAEVFTIAWRRRRSLPIEPLPWLYGTARRVLGNDLRGSRRRDRLTERLTRDPTTRPMTPAAEPPSEADWVLGALALLSDSDQEVLRLAAWEDLSTDQLAVVLRCSRSAAAMRLHRARERLRDVFANDSHLADTLRRSR